MALIWFDGCGEYYDTGDIDDVWHHRNNAVTVLPTSGRRGGACLELDSFDTLEYGFPIKTTVTIGFAIRFSSIPGSDQVFLELKSRSDVQIQLEVSSAGAIAIKRGTSSYLNTSAAGLVFGATWHYVELQVTINNTTGSYEVRLDGVNIMSGTNVDTQASGNANVDAFLLDASSAGIRYDDLYILDDTGAAPQNDFLGDSRVEVVFPDGAGNSSQWTPSAGSNWQNVDDNPADDDSTYNESSTTNDIDLYTYANPPAITGGSTFWGVKAMAKINKQDAGDRNFRIVARPTSTNRNGASQPLSTDWLYRHEIWDIDPETSSAWTDSTFNASEFGAEVL